MGASDTGVIRAEIVRSEWQVASEGLTRLTTLTKGLIDAGHIVEFHEATLVVVEASLPRLVHRGGDGFGRRDDPRGREFG